MSLPILEWAAMKAAVGAMWTAEDVEYIRDHLRKVDQLATELVELARTQRDTTA